MSIIPEGPETQEDQVLRAWFEEQEHHNLERLEEGAKTITQLVTALYGVLFAVLAFGEQLPAYLLRPVVQWAGTVSLVALFLALIAALVTVFPRRYRHERDNLRAMRQAFRRMHRVKRGSVAVALGCFLVGMLSLVVLILAVLWGW